MGYEDVVCNNRVLASVCKEQPTVLGNGLSYLVVFMGPIWPITHLDEINSQYWKLHLVTRDGKLFFHSLIL